MKGGEVHERLAGHRGHAEWRCLLVDKTGRTKTRNAIQRADGMLCGVCGVCGVCGDEVMFELELGLGEVGAGAEVGRYSGPF